MGPAEVAVAGAARGDDNMETVGAATLPIMSLFCVCSKEGVGGGYCLTLKLLYLLKKTYTQKNELGT